MQAQIERRAHAQRVPMDQGVVEVSFVEYGEKAPADAVNIAEGGLSLRASILPEVGTEMRCAFPMPDGQSIEADCEVVWAQHSGPYAGEFGLRFTDIARLDEERIRDYVSAHSGGAEWDDAEAADSDGGYVDDSDPGFAARVADSYEPAAAGRHERAAAKHPAIPDTIRLYIDGVSSPVAASVVQATHDVLVVEQALPFLRLGTAIAAIEGGPKGKLASVELRMVDGAPRLMLTVLFGDESSLPGSDPELAVGEPVRSDVAYARTQLRSPLDTLPDADDQLAAEAVDDLGAAAQPHAVGLALEDARHSSVPPARFVDARPSRAPSGASAWARGSAATDELDDLDELDEYSDLGAEPDERHDVAAEPEAGLSAGDSPVDRLSLMLQLRTRQLRERAAPLKARARDLSARGVRGLLPALRALLTRLMHMVGLLRDNTKPALVGLSRRAQATVVQLRGGQAGRVTKTGRPLRRQQSRMGTSMRPGSTQAPAAEATPRVDPLRARRRTVALSVLAFGLVATTVWALTSGSEDAAATPTDTSDTDSTSSTVSESATPSAVPGSAAVSPYVAPSEPALHAAPAATAASGVEAPAPGPLAEPTYPTLGADRPQSPGSVPTDSPYAEGAVAEAEVHEGRSFGADSVSNARRFEIAMSVAVANLRGRTTDTGFVIDIPNALAMGGARTISRNHPMVARSHILNHGDHSTLTVDFVEGQSPAYRVSAQGATLQIEIAR